MPASANTTARPRRRPPSSAAHANSVPTATTTKPPPVTPTSGSSDSQGESTTAKPTRPHGNPPNGHDARRVLTPVHTAAAQTGHPDNDRTWYSPTPNSANQPGWTTDSPNHAAVDAVSHHSNTPMNARPKPNPSRADPRRVAPV